MLHDLGTLVAKSDIRQKQLQREVTCIATAPRDQSAVWDYSLQRLTRLVGTLIGARLQLRSPIIEGKPLKGESLDTHQLQTGFLSG